MAEAKRGRGGPSQGVFVVTSGQANRIGKLRSKCLDRPGTAPPATGEMLQRPAQRRHCAEQRQPWTLNSSCCFRVQLEKCTAEKIFVEPTNTRESAEHAAKIRSVGHCDVFWPVDWQKNRPIVLFCLFFKTRLHAALKFPVGPSAEAGFEKIGKKTFSWFDSLNR